MAYNNNTSNIMTEDFIPGFQIMCLTPEEDEYQNQYSEDYCFDQTNEPCCDWMDDCEVQENLATILPLNPEECVIDKENHIQSRNGVKLFFEELGVLTEEPEPIDPSRDYEAEARILIEERNKTRRKHIDLPPVPSLDDNIESGVSSTASSFHGCCDTEHALVDIRSPLYMGPSHCGQTKPQAYSYAYAPHVMSSIRTPI